MENKLASPTWLTWEQEIQREIDSKGIQNFRSYPRMQHVIQVNTIEHYKRYVTEMESYFDLEGSKLVEFGAGYGGMVPLWLEAGVSEVTNIDLPVMLSIQKHYVVTEAGINAGVNYVPNIDVEKVDFTDKYFFSAFAFTETTPDVWDYYIENVFPRVKGAYIFGSNGWAFDQLDEHSWDKLQKVFKALLYVNREDRGDHSVVWVCGKNE